MYPTAKAIIITDATAATVTNGKGAMLKSMVSEPMLPTESVA